jgi:hypothetical protein
MSASFSPLSILNQSSASILVQQLPSQTPMSIAEAFRASQEDSQARGLLLLPDHSSAVYGWLYPEKPNRFLHFTLNTAAEVVFKRNSSGAARVRGRKKKPFNVRKPIKGARKKFKKIKKLAEKKSPSALDADETRRTECVTVVLDTSKINSSSTGYLYYSLPALPTCNAPTEAVAIDVILMVEWSSSGRVVRIVDRDDAEAAVAKAKAQAKSKGRVRPVSTSTRQSRLSRSLSNTSSQVPVDTMDSSKSSLSFSIDFSSIGASLVGESRFDNHRRELLSAYLRGFHYEQRQVTIPSVSSNRGKTCLTSFVLSAADLQIDNYSETVVYPVIFRRDFSLPHGEAKEKSPDAYEVPFLKFGCLVEKNVSTEGLAGQLCYHYATVNVMPFCIEIDSATILLLYQDFFSRSDWFSEEEALCVACPADWVAQYNHSLRRAWQRQSSLLDLADTKARSLQAKCLYEKIIIHPIKVYCLLFYVLFVCVSINVKSDPLGSN